MTPSDGPPSQPQRYGRYLITDRIGHGGMAEVFLALSTGPEGFQRQVALKCILPHLGGDPEFVRMFIDEARVCGRLSHPNIVQVHELGLHDGRYFIVME